MRIKKFVALVLILLMLLPAFAVSATDDGVVIRVGWFGLPGACEVNGGVYSGYDFDYLTEISKYTGWKYEFVEVDFAECLDMLAAGELDILGSLLYSGERAARFDYSQLEYGHTYTTLFTSEQSDIEPYDFERFDGMRVGVIVDAVNENNLAEFAAENGFSYEAVAFESFNELSAAIRNEDVDAGIIGGFTDVMEMRALAEFAPQPYYFATTKGNASVLDGLDNALRMIKLDNPYLETSLYKKHFGGRILVDLSAAEHNIVKASEQEPVRVGIIPASAPICFWDEKTGAYSGICIEMLDAITENTGLQMEYVPIDLMNNAPVAWLKAGEFPLVAGILKTQNFLDDPELKLSSPLLIDAIGIAARKGEDFTADLSNNKLAVINGFQVAMEYAAEHFPEHEVVNYPSMWECMRAVARGSVGATVNIDSCTNYLLQDPHFESLEKTTAFERSVEICAAGLSDGGAELISVIDKGLAMISDAERADIIMDYTVLHPYRLSLNDTLYKYRLPLAVIAVLIMLVFAVFVALISFRRNSERQLKAAYEQERAALTLAERASDAKSRFISRMSHEIRTPLNAVVGYNTIARSELASARSEAELKAAGERVMDCLTKSDIASTHLLTVINDVLDMSAIESGKITVAHELFDFKSLISSLTALFYSQAQHKSVDFQVVFKTPTDEWFVGDQMRVNQILTNLLSNAIKFTPEGGGVKLVIQQSGARGNAAHMRFEVIDEGVGIDEKFLAQIWNPYEQDDDSAGRASGSGLGLTITKNLVDLMGGEISAKSEAGVGTAFTVDLTFERTAQPDSALAGGISGLNVLIADDESSRDYLERLLKLCGASCSKAGDINEAVDMVAAASSAGDPYDVCIVGWPHDGGADAHERLREASGEHKTAVVAASYDGVDDETDTALAGVDAFIAKPLFLSSLTKLLADVVAPDAFGAKSPSDGIDFKGARVLLAEDNRMNMEVARSILTAVGFEVDCAWDGREAVSMFTASAPNAYKAVILDIHMPVLDGHEAAREIRASERADAKTVPIIAMTADAFAENAAEAAASGMDAHIAKPFDPKTLFDTLGKLIGN